MTIVPKRISIEASSVCQLRCKTCPTGQRTMPVVGRGFLSFDHFKQLIDNNKTIKKVELANFGEILLNPQLIDIIRYSYEKKIELYADNGVNFNTASDELLDALVKYRFHSLTCAIDGASESTYQQYRVGGSFTNVINNVRKLQLIKKKYRTGYPVLTWQYVIFGHNEHEIEQAEELAQELGMTFKVKLNWDDSFSPVKDCEYIKRVTGLKITSRNEFEAQYKKVYLSSTCHQLWDQPYINWNGTLLGCCWNYWGDFGKNAFTHTLEESLNSEKLEYAKKMLLGKASAREDIPCTTCDNYKHMLSTGTYLDRSNYVQLKLKLKQFAKALLTTYRELRHR